MCTSREAGFRLNLTCYIHSVIPMPWMKLSWLSSRRASFLCPVHLQQPYDQRVIIKQAGQRGIVSIAIPQALFRSVKIERGNGKFPIKTILKGVENGRKMGVRSMLRNVDFTNTGSVQFPRESITILGSWKYLISAAHL